MKEISILDAESELQQLVEKNEDSILTSMKTLELFTEFFFEYNIKNFSKTSDTDMGLFQYGIYDWGNGEWFELDFVRQFIFMDENGEHEKVDQLHFTLYFNPKLAHESIKNSYWYDHNLGKDEWINKIKSSKGFDIVKDVSPEKYIIYYETV